MNSLLSLITDGIFLGISIAVLSAGLALTVNVIKIINLSHGAFFLLGCYIAYSASLLGPTTSLLLLPVAFLGPALIGFFIGKTIVNRLRRDSFSIAVATLAVAILFEQAAQLVWGDRALSIHQGNPVFSMMGIEIYRWHLGELALMAFLITFFIFFPGTKLGMSMRITSEDEEMAKSVGVDTDLARALAFSISAGIASFAGFITAPGLTIFPTSDRAPLIISLIVVIISGHEKLLPVLVIGTVLGIVSNLIAGYLPSYANYTGMLIIIVILLSVKHSGLFGHQLERDY
jgi:branched-subunit amino acid ABC-type transport system permease component